MTLLSSRRGLFLHDDGVRAGRQFAAGENAHRLSRPDFAGIRPPGRDFADDFQIGRRAGDVLGAHRIAVHRRHVGRRLRSQRSQIVGEHAPMRFRERHTFGWQRARLRQHALQGIGDRQQRHRANPSVPVGPGFAAGFFEQTDAFDSHAAFCRLHHVVDRQARDRHRRQRLHLDAGRTGDLDGRAHDDARQRRIGRRDRR